MKLLEDVRSAASSAQVYCTNCGAANAPGQRECSNCDFPLEMPTTFVGNILGALAWPQRGLRKIVATAPVMQSFLVVVAAAALVLLVQMIELQLRLQQALTDLPKLRAEVGGELYALRALGTPLRNLNFQGVRDVGVTDLVGRNPAPDATVILTSLVQSIVTWFLFSGAVYLLSRLFYKKEAITNFKGLLALVGFARVSWLALLVALPVISASDFADAAQVLVLIAAIWQLALIVTGVKQGMRLTWNRALTVVLLPAVLIVLVFGIYELILFA